MATKTRNYQNGKIYTIRSHQTDKVYYGSTTQLLCKRIAKHRYCYKDYKDNKCRYITSFEIVQYDDAYIELYEDYPCETKNELEKQEGEIIRANTNAVNKNIAGRSNKEYREDNKEAIKKYLVDNKDRISITRKTYCQVNKDKLNAYKKEHNKTLSKETKEIIKAKLNTKYQCNKCAGKFSIRSKSRHEKSEMHQTALSCVVI